MKFQKILSEELNVKRHVYDIIEAYMKYKNHHIKIIEKYMKVNLTIIHI